jgi:hypothetical protein
MPDTTIDFAKLMGSSAFIVGEVLFVCGLILGSVGAACANDTLAGVDECKRSAGIICLSVGAGTVLLAIIIMTITFLYQSPYFGVEGRCQTHNACNDPNRK